MLRPVFSPFLYLQGGVLFVEAVLKYLERKNSIPNIEIFCQVLDLIVKPLKLEGKRFIFPNFK